jgi:ATP-dependent Lhr-like helicase
VRRALRVEIAGGTRYIATEDAARYRDALGVPLPPGIPPALLEPVPDPLADLALRYARTHAPFTASDFAKRYGLGPAAAEALLVRLATEARLLEGEFRPGGTRREWTDHGVLRMIRRRSLAKLRREVEPVDQSVLARFATHWQGVVKRRRGVDALLDVIEQLQSAPVAASIIETEILPARLEAYDAGDLDAIMASGEVVWIGVEPLGERDGRIALYLADCVEKLLPPDDVRLTPDAASATGARDTTAAAILEYLGAHGASFFGPLHEAAGGGYPAETVRALWDLAWRGLITNDTFHALRAFTASPAPRRRAKRPAPPVFRSRRLVPPAAEGRWSLVRRAGSKGSTTRWATAAAQQLLNRHGILTREAAGSENLPGGFGAVYPVLKALEEHGRIRRGYFVAGLGATQFALPGALDLLRSLRALDDEPEIVVLSATDPSTPYGTALKVPASGANVPRGFTRTVGASVILVDGALTAYLGRGDRQLLSWLPETEPQRSRAGRAVAQVFIDRARSGDDAPRGMLIEEIDGLPPATHPMATWLVEAGFIAGALGFQATYPRAATT